MTWPLAQKIIFIALQETIVEKKVCWVMLLFGNGLVAPRERITFGENSSRGSGATLLLFGFQIIIRPDFEAISFITTCC